jgi:anti-sigma regulatory factor (Ser/Thr protein kinase)
MEELALHVLDIAENSIVADARLIEVEVIEDEQRDSVTIRIADDGRGMPPEMLAMAGDPFFSTKAGHQVGLGIPMFAQAAREAEGSFSVESAPGKGTRITAEFKRSHVDRMPVGALSQTMVVLMCSHPEVEFVCSHVINGETVYRVDTRPTATEEPSKGTGEECQSSR